MVNATAQLEGLGETLIPAINRLQDIFSQVGLGVGVVRRDCTKLLVGQAASLS